MKKLLIVVDMQNDFISGALGTKEAVAIVPNVRKKIDGYKKSGQTIIFTQDTHGEDYLKTQEGKFLPVPHCIDGTKGHEITEELDVTGCEIFRKPNFGSIELAQKVKSGGFDEVELCGLCTDICVVSNALILKAALPEILVSVDENCCAGVTKESHAAAITTMKMCQVQITSEVY